MLFVGVWEVSSVCRFDVTLGSISAKLLITTSRNKKLLMTISPTYGTVDNTNKELYYHDTMSDNQPVPNPMAAPGQSPSGATATSANKPAAAAPAAAKPSTPQQQALQQQIQAQLQAQLQQQLQAAAAKGKQANITPEMIQVCGSLKSRYIFDSFDV